MAISHKIKPQSPVKKQELHSFGNTLWRLLCPVQNGRCFAPFGYAPGKIKLRSWNPELWFDQAERS
jgi:hypothetical protein